LESEAEDVVQEVLLTIHLKQGTWDPSREIGPWLTAITRNKIIDVFRRRGRRIEVPIDGVMDSLQAEEELTEFRPRDIDALVGKFT
jgi:RNA polymerase sigma-70 factor (ECF subfamily)